MEYTQPRSEPRVELGTRLIVLLKREDEWHELSAFTVNVSESGLLVTLQPAPQVGDWVRIRLPDENFEGEAEVVYVVSGNMNALVGMRLRHKQGKWLVPSMSA
jgi:hypothetical protein